MTDLVHAVAGFVAIGAIAWILSEDRMAVRWRVVAAGAVLQVALADGTIFRGRSIGADGLAVGEVVFNTAITGYQEILTDPSYCRQIVTLTYPHIGNTGVNEEDH